MRKFDRDSVKNAYSNDAIVKSYLDKQKLSKISTPEKIVIERYTTKNSRIIDIGCGTGRISFALETMGYEQITAIDISEKMIKVAKQEDVNSKVQFEVKDIVRDQVINQFDCAIAMHGITPIPGHKNRLTALKKIHRMLNKNGLLIISSFLQNPDDVFWKEQKSNWLKDNIDNRPTEYGDIIHRKYETEIFIHVPEMKTFKNTIEAAGFEIIDILDWTQLIEGQENIIIDNAQKCTYWITKVK